MPRSAQMVLSDDGNGQVAGDAGRFRRSSTDLDRDMKTREVRNAPFLNTHRQNPRNPSGQEDGTRDNPRKDCGKPQSRPYSFKAEATMPCSR